MTKDKDFKQDYKAADKLDKDLPEWEAVVAKRAFYAGLNVETLEDLRQSDVIYSQMCEMYELIKPMCEKLYGIQE